MEGFLNIGRRGRQKFRPASGFSIGAQEGGSR